MARAPDHRRIPYWADVTSVLEPSLSCESTSAKIPDTMMTRQGETPTPCYRIGEGEYVTLETRSSLRPIPPVVFGILLVITACSPDPTGLDAPSRFASVVFRYAAPTTPDPAVATMFPQCVMGVGVTHLHAGWRGFQASALTAIGQDLWEITFSDVPVGSEQRIRISDPNTCALNATGASTEGVSANDTPLVRVVDTPGSGTEPGLAFTVAADGSNDP